MVNTSTAFSMSDFASIRAREAGLPAVLGPWQMSSVAFGVVLSYGLIVVSTLPMREAGAYALIAYFGAGLAALLLMRCLAALTATHPAPGAFASWAEHYLGPGTGFVVRCAYIAAIVMLLGTEVALISPVMHLLLPGVPKDAAPLLVLVLLAGLNMGSVLGFARTEVFLSAIKVGALLVFSGLALFYALSATPPPATGAPPPIPWPAVGQAFVLAVLGYVGLESIAIAAAESRATRVSRQIRLVGWLLIGLITLLALAAAALEYQEVLPWGAQPLFSVLRKPGIPAVALMMNLLIVLTMVSVANSLMYCASRMVFSLGRAQPALAGLARIPSGIPRRAVATTLAAAMLVYAGLLCFPNTFFYITTAIAVCCLLLVWLTIFVCHACLRIREGKKPFAGVLGALLVLGIALATWWTELLASTLSIGLPFIGMLICLYGMAQRFRYRRR
ncbi:amino acid permease [Bordetella avium]|uniref:amino acid permease n=2 Tax=Bordetella avium TaxID=521 RepID=UPI000E69693B|nr:amino acid permease [Bordetella avium]RIQ19331.1 amino acid permease [Bordetella avium]RIQ33499.1 amino acid permease [Bordetella avium]RIQ72854.1 amino acid permease [Bordetella avium]